MSHFFGLFADLSTAIHGDFAPRNRMNLGIFTNRTLARVAAISTPPERALLSGRACSAAGTPEGLYSFRDGLGSPLARTGRLARATFARNINV